MAKGLSFAALMEQAARAIKQGADPSRLFADIGARMDALKQTVATNQQASETGISELRSWFQDELAQAPQGRGYAWRAASSGQGKDTYIEAGKNALYFVVNGVLVGSITADGDLLLAGSFRTVTDLAGNPRFIDGEDTAYKNVRWAKSGLIEIAWLDRTTDPTEYLVIATIDGNGDFTTSHTAETGQSVSGTYPTGVWDAGTSLALGPLYFVVAGNAVASFDDNFEFKLNGGIYTGLNTGRIKAGAV